MTYETKIIMNYSYNTCDIIGKGFSSVVYKGINTNTKDYVAIKVINRKFSEQLPAIQNEIHILRSLQGRHILKFYDHFASKNNIYIITEYCKQGDLGQRLKQQGYFKQDQAVAMVKQIIDGIYVMAQQNIIHRDLKPQNILLNEQDVRIADFGFAKPLNKLKNEMNVGTPIYMSPETLIKSQYTSKTDIWSLGVVFYELLYGKPPWVAQTEQELIFKVLNKSVVFPDFPFVSDSVKDLIKQCLIIDPYMRLSLNDLIQHPVIKRSSKQIVKPNETESTDQTIKSEVPNASDPWTYKNSDKKLVQINYKNPQINTIMSKYLNPNTTNQKDNKQIKDNQSNFDEITSILQSQFNLCLFLNIMISKVRDQKLQTPLLNEKCRIIFSKHLQNVKENIYKQLIEGENNFKFKEWSLYCKENTYNKFSAKFILENAQFNKTIKDYNEMIKSNKSLIIEYQKYDSEFYQILFGLEWKIIRKIIKNLILEFNHMIIQSVDFFNQSYQITKNQATEIILLQQLCCYLEMIDKFFLKNFDQEKFAKESKIQSYLKAKDMKMSDYLEIRFQIKNLMRN
ncbi:unnamed protein product [Paramecium octaurelia]|uniref:Protein kinase domain-containing protein n=1 Tax=Paramecium octaurelia TaxID=43137 RepID=A0A8S1T3N1_PAROT|nr:unnamed protein product [Paramecium octaurelia]